MSGASARTAQVPTSFDQVDQPAVGVDVALPLEFLNLPMQQETALDETQHEVGIGQVYMTINLDDPKPDYENPYINGKFPPVRSCLLSGTATMTKLFVCACEAVRRLACLEPLMMSRELVTLPKSPALHHMGV